LAIANLIRKMKWSDESLIKAAVRTVRFNLLKINRFIIYELDLTNEIAKPSVEKLGYRIQIMGYEELEAYGEKMKIQPRELKMHQIDGVKYCVVILKEDEIVHISWLYMKGDRSRCFDLKEGESLLNYSYTFPEHRGLRLNIQAWYGAAHWLKGRGIRRMFTNVHESTEFQLRSLSKVDGLKEIRKLSQWFVYRPKFKREKAAGSL
jgi:hypothetical protein